MPKGIKGYQKGHSTSKETREKIGLASKGRKHTLEANQKNRIAHLGKIAWNKGKKFSIESRKKMSLAHKNKPLPWNRGNKSHFWKGGVTPQNMKIRMSLEYKLWRTAVFERDNYICIWCGQRGGKLNADHVKPFALYPELRFAIDNGRTLCVNCHKKTETFGIKLYNLKARINKNGN